MCIRDSGSAAFLRRQWYISRGVIKPSIGIGMIGYKFMGKAHSNAYRQINQFFDLPLRTRLKTIAGRDGPKTQKMAERWGWEESTTDWRRVKMCIRDR